MLLASRKMSQIGNWLAVCCDFNLSTPRLPSVVCHSTQSIFRYKSVLNLCSFIWALQSKWQEAILFTVPSIDHWSFTIFDVCPDFLKGFWHIPTTSLLGLLSAILNETFFVCCSGDLFPLHRKKSKVFKKMPQNQVGTQINVP